LTFIIVLCRDRFGADHVRRIFFLERESGMDYARSNRKGRNTTNPSALTLFILPGLLLFLLGFAACGNESDNDERWGKPPATKSPEVRTISGTKVEVKTAIASNSTASEVPSWAFDGDTKTFWSAGAYAPQWIQLDFGEPVDFTGLRLSVSQTPAGATGHQIYAGPTPDKMTLVATLEANAQDRQWLETKATAKKVRFIKVSTMKSPSWVAWREIEVYK
jgi:hypothetical protein